MVRGLTPLYFPCNGNTEKGAFPTFYDEITLLNVVKYTCYQADGFKRSDWATSPLLRQRMPKTLYTREIHIQNSYTERSIQMPKVMIIECSDEEADRLVEQIKGIIAEPQYQPFRGPGKVYEFGSLRIDQPKREVTLHGNAVKLNHREFEILDLFASHPNQALSASFLHNAVWLHPDSEHGEEEAAAYVRSLQEKLGLNKSNPTCRIVEGTCKENKGCCFTFLVD